MLTYALWKKLIKRSDKYNNETEISKSDALSPLPLYTQSTVHSLKGTKKCEYYGELEMYVEGEQFTKTMPYFSMGLLIFICIFGLLPEFTGNLLNS